MIYRSLLLRIRVNDLLILETHLIKYIEYLRNFGSYQTIKKAGIICYKEDVKCISES